MGKYEEIKSLLKLQLDILQNGKIIQDESGLFESEKDRERLQGLFALQDKYTYGWYIAEQSLDEQIISISQFIEYIINNFKEEKPDGIR